MIYLTTGQPGAGKTLFTIDEVRKIKDRPVFYSGIPDLKLPWIELKDPEKWHECADGSIVVIDEAQRIFRPRGNGAQVPAHVEALETHRHKGIDLYVITQHPMLVDSNLRRLVGVHRHVMRAFGSKIANVHEWQEVNQQPDRSRKDSQVKTWAYPKDVFDLYKSAEVHTHKLRFPPRLLFLLLLPIVLGVTGYVFWQWNSRQSTLVEDALKTDEKSLLTDNAMPTEAKDKPTYDLASFTPRVEGLPETAPRYDELTTAKRAPQLAGCIASATRCRCYQPTGERYHTTYALCRQVVDSGVPFIDWVDPDKDHRQDRAVGASEARRQPALAEVQPADPAPVGTPREAGETVHLDPAKPSGMSYQTALALRAMQRPGE